MTGPVFDMPPQMPQINTTSDADGNVLIPAADWAMLQLYLSTEIPNYLERFTRFVANNYD